MKVLCDQHDQFLAYMLQGYLVVFCEICRPHKEHVSPCQVLMLQINKLGTYHNSTQCASSTTQATTLSWKTLLPINSRPSLLIRASGWANTIEVLPFTTSWRNFCCDHGHVLDCFSFISEQVLSWFFLVYRWMWYIGGYPPSFQNFQLVFNLKGILQ